MRLTNEHLLLENPEAIRQSCRTAGLLLQKGIERKGSCELPRTSKKMIIVFLIKRPWRQGKSEDCGPEGCRIESRQTRL